MKGRADTPDGCDAAIWNHDPKSTDGAVGKQEYPTRTILNAHDALIAASSQHALASFFARNLPHRDVTYFPIGIPSQISDLGDWIGTYRDVALSERNFVVVCGRRLLKWPKQKFRLFVTQNEERLDRVVDAGVVGA